ncbi:SOS response-associated peptidase [Marinoscillum furvescens]|uniref:Abasic site processing protein n=1 Tax=Marinoscillum furvescens DSM 4134 TaxID=1122208 RepID=A0A3D9L7G1_MARFU|nr:SOS response-associated peptidase family protein [Marinoscillum furvescens]REE01051.1 putative SOS response-associated peptidase YedK [Marinoscillum furvescens DSM 4134]
MCYDVRYLTQKKKKYADHIGKDATEIDKLERQLEEFTLGPVYHTTAFEHWRMPVVTSDKPTDFQFYHWGLIPHFVKDTEQYFGKYASRYLNCRIETLFDEKMYNAKLNRDLDNPFYKSALERRCVVVLDGYYDWHWQGKNSYNFHILLKSEEPMLIAGIWRTWQSKTEDITRDTVGLVTTDANPLCRRVHNKPKASEGPRQLAILDQESAEAWLEPDLTADQLKKNVRVFPETELKAFPVKKLFHQSGRKRISLNDPECIQEASFPELQFGKEATNGSQGSLF